MKSLMLSYRNTKKSQYKYTIALGKSFPFSMLIHYMEETKLTFLNFLKPNDTSSKIQICVFHIKVS